MGVYITAKLLDQIGLVLGFISGFFLIPEIINFLPLVKFQESIERQLYRFEYWTKFPLRFGPPSWKLKFTEDQREAIEPITAIGSFVFSMVWIAVLAIGLLLSSKIFIIFGFTILVLVALGNVARIRSLWPRLNVATLILMFIASLFMLAILTPLISLIRVTLLILRSMVTKVHSFFSIHDVLRTLLTMLAIIFFIISNILQFVATLL